jgi:hypothetical protein
MKTNIVTIVGASALVFALAIGFAIVRPALAQVAATSTESTPTSTPPVDEITSSTPTDTSSTPPVENTSSSTTPVEAGPTNAATPIMDSSQAAAQESSAQKSPTEPPPTGLTEVHIIGRKYIDYFTDGSTTIAVPSDPNIDGNLDKPDAPIPTHEGMTWVHTMGQYLYDTPSGDLEVGDYAVQPDGSYLASRPPFVSSTSTPAQLPATTTDNAAEGTSSSVNSVTPTSVPGTSTSTGAAPADSSNDSTTTSESTTSPANPPAPLN